MGVYPDTTQTPQPGSSLGYLLCPTLGPWAKEGVTGASMAAKGRGRGEEGSPDRGFPKKRGRPSTAPGSPRHSS